jgi:FkbM family methyltransferase
MKNIYNVINNILTTNLNICDVGAAGGVHERWSRIDNLFVVGFEPDEREYKNLVNTSKEKWFNIGLNHSKGKFPLYITGYQTNTSLYKPNEIFTKELCYGANDFKIEKTLEVECDTIDHVLEENQIKLDYIKLDTQGSELDILKGGILSLEQDIFAVEAEVEFNELYQNQPMFADVDIFLRDKGYILMDIGNMLHVKGKNSVGIGGLKSFLISGDALYFKSIDNAIKLIEKYGVNKLNNIVSICLVYGYNDYALELCYKLEDKNLIDLSVLNNWREELKKLNMVSHHIPEFKYKSYVQKLFTILSDAFSRTKNAAWINNLGNIRD